MLPDRAVTGADLPVREVLPALVAALTGGGRPDPVSGSRPDLTGGGRPDPDGDHEPGRHPDPGGGRRDPGGVAVLVAPPGTGKTTLVPLALAGEVTGRVVVAQPRRIAVRAAARRMAWLVGGEVGDAVGYTIRGERRVGPATRVEVVTTGVLVRRLQRDPDLPGTGAVILDECHERHLDADLALAFMLDVRATLRPDLLLLATSATADTPRLAGVLGAPGPPAPVVGAATARFDVEVVWSPPPGPLTPAHGLRVDPRLLDHVAATVGRALRETSGDVLVFLPGAGEIAAVAGRLAGHRDSVDVLALHGRQSGGTQDAALRPGPRRRVVLATAVAESSLTVPGVRVVVDAGLARSPRMDHARGLGSLVTVRVSRSSAGQRAGRAGREAPGRVYRCWSAAEHDRLPAQAEPEVAVADLTGFALDLALWGHPGGDGLGLLSDPPAGAMDAARASLRALGALDDAGRVTPRGRSIAAVGVHPRLAGALLAGAGVVGAGRAADIVAVLSGDGPAGGSGPGSGSDDLLAAWRRLRANADRAASARWREESRRLRSAVAAATAAAAAAAVPADAPAARPGDGVTDDLAAGLVVGLAFPERLARARVPGGTTYLMAGGTAAELAAGSALTGAQWLAVAVADRGVGRASARVRLAVALDEATAREAGAALRRTDEEVAWSGGDVVARRVERLGAIVLTERPLARPDPALLEAAVLDGLRREGLATLRWTRDAAGLRQRLAFCHRFLGAPWPDVADTALLAAAPDWLGPDLAGVRRRADLERIDAGQALRRLLPWPQAARLDALAPERLVVPSGSRVRLDYSDPDGPVLAVKVAEVFGWERVPPVADGRVPVVLHLLSPAGRPVAVTSDLASFWRTGYPRVRAELRGRYPRHPWPDDPTTAPPTRRVTPRARG
ncbi:MULTISPECIES: ATP-dependent helicase HrpB [Frankia]|uniref:HrpA-like helicase, ATP-dependent n=1 Tax=Frankia alni (strain DSM 45986 / CECT 9034 / ACN14a) TaxID=326424 RepID=Q0RIL0_FRAAA|nr:MULTISPECIES: ATP-dependent helicase HrpB [Frankia]CAJ62658.1 HrpA-like helicase, ATP-dependent [Frankia alni ACN14a]